MAPRLSRALVALGAVLLGAAALAFALSGFRVALGPIDVTVSRPVRPAAQGLALLLVAEALRIGPPTRRARLRFVALFAAFSAALVLESAPRLVGDGHEYVAMAWQMARGLPPSLPAEELPRAEALLPPRVDGYRWDAPELVAPDGRQDFYHLWLYSLAATPFVAAALALGAPVLSAFAVLNGILLMGSVAIALARCGPRVALVVFGGALAWWFDKAHTELFVVSLLVVAVLLLADHPAVSLILQGLVALQNPTLAVYLAASAVWLMRTGRFASRATRLGLVAAVTLVAVGPLYYLSRVGQASPLSKTLVPHVPSLAEVLAILVDPNLGLLFAWPALCVAVLVAAVVALGSGAWRGFGLPLVLAAGSAAVILIAVTQPGNLNSGGTRSVSRYALWLVPLAVPLLAWFDERSVRARAFLVAMVAGSLITALGDYHPRMNERYVSPTPVARWLWRAHPRATNPLPEVFGERTAHFEGPGILPTATEGCEKALLVGDDSPVGAWPLWCRPQAVPEWCARKGAYCYAHPGGSATAFVAPPRQAGFVRLRPVAWYWSGAPDDGLVSFLARIPWSQLWTEDPDGVNGVIVQRQGLGAIAGKMNRDVVLTWIERPRYPASVTFRPWPAHHAVLIDPMQGKALASVPLHPRETTLLPIPYRAPLLLVVAPSSLLPAESLVVSGTPAEP